MMRWPRKRRRPSTAFELRALRPCPSCGGQLVMQLVDAERTAGEVEALTGRRLSGDPSTVVSIVVPWVSCGSCGFIADASTTTPA
ncbi:hypothetical protein [Agromyces sp. S2-1-8]|uniref:hypothetical protein n=1 Tax=Agromyces sp. S2-1-8 TaxID=2897180 RepID=UPI001E604492|nr:hypothetical protein [Agromyces sp. S2-1-8]MCD5345042.1 hypothetical protein [Agromyces sp. S2-1-8]